MSASSLVELRDVKKCFGKTVTAAGVSLALGRGEFFALLGPSGSGKSTILRMIAGLEQPDSGCILIDGHDVTDLPPWRRELGMVFQSYAVFPHLTVAQNVGYGLRRRQMSRDAIDARIRELLDLVGLRGFGDRYPQALSGGEQQRVAIARALAPKPQVLLLDEPLSALDEKIRREMQTELRDIQQQTATTFVYVTHDQEEALTMSDRVAVLNHGHVVQVGLPDQIFRRPRTPFVARFFRGCNVLKIVRTPNPETPHLAGVALPTLPTIGSTCIAIRAEDVRLDTPEDSAALHLDADLEASTYRGLYTEHRLRLQDGQFLAAVEQGYRSIAPGTSVRISIRPADIVPLAPD